MLIIVEGPDGVGKTTVVEKIQKEIFKMDRFAKTEVLRKGPPKLHPLDEYETPLLSYRPGGHHHIICDRWHVGEWVYPSILQRKTVADRALWYHIEMFLASRGALMVRLTRDPDVLFKRVFERGDSLIAPSDVLRIAQAYDLLTVDGLLPMHMYISDVESVESIIADAVMHEAAAQQLSRLVTYIGPPNPSRLLIGDVRHGLSRDTWEGDLRPAFMPYRATSGGYLLNALRRSMMHGLGIINACDVDDLERAYETLRRPPTVALGMNAYDHARKSGITVPGVPHPQYVRRFHHKSHQEYADVIRNAFHGEDGIAWRP